MRQVCMGGNDDAQAAQHVQVRVAGLREEDTRSIDTFFAMGG